MIHFVGAGPGAPDLITIRGRKLVEEADVIIYAGSLVSADHLDHAKAGCEIHDSSKMTLDEVIAVMADAESRGLTTVRLHTGDPSIFGAIREQMDELDARGIAHDLCPGVSSLFGAAAALEHEFTLPEVAQSVIITRAAGRTPVPDGESIRSFAAHRTSMAIFLSASLADDVSRDLIAGGYPPETPAAIVQRATWPDERTFRCTVADLGETARANGITKTALFIVGDALAGSDTRSRLYAPEFATGVRPARDETREKK